MKKYVIIMCLALLCVGCGKRNGQRTKPIREEEKPVWVEKRPEVRVIELPEVDTVQEKKEATTEPKKRAGGGGSRRPSGKAYEQDESFVWSNEVLDSALLKRMEGRSWRSGCPLDPADFSYIRFQHHNFHGGVSTGEMVVDRRLASDVLQIFYELYQAGYPIERVRLVDDYGANDEASMSANNTSSFNYREMTNASSGKLSKHALGRAIDLNPLYNPYVKELKDGSVQVLPHGGRPYADRSDSVSNPYRIDENDAAYRIFKRHGWRWGGDFRHSKDYQHFEK